MEIFTIDRNWAGEKNIHGKISSTSNKTVVIELNVNVFFHLN
jgi:hypothetical protein